MAEVVFLRIPDLFWCFPEAFGAVSLTFVALDANSKIKRFPWAGGRWFGVCLSLDLKLGVSNLLVGVSWLSRLLC